MKNVLGGATPLPIDACAGKSSTTSCRNADGGDLTTITATGCSHFMNNCSGYSGSSIDTTTCTCVV